MNRRNGKKSGQDLPPPPQGFRSFAEYEASLSERGNLEKILSDRQAKRSASESPMSSLAPESPDSENQHTNFSRPARSLKASVIRIVGLSTVGAGLIAAIFALLWLSELGVFDIPQERLQPVAELQHFDNSIVFDRNGRKIGEYFNSHHVYVPFEKLPQHLIDAITAIEDRNFWTHDGYDLKAMMRAAWVYAKRFVFTNKNQPSQGASTITQQVVRNFLLPREKSIQRKVQEIAYAIELEKIVSKEKIFEIYANSLFLGNGSYGIGSAARRYFGKPASKLNPAESALIAGLFQSPSRYNPVVYRKRARKRQITVVKAMHYAGYLTRAEAKDLLRKRLRYRSYRPENGKTAPYFIDYVKERAAKLLGKSPSNINNSGLRIYTTLDTKLQRLAKDSIKDSQELFEEAEQNTIGSVATFRKKIAPGDTKKPHPQHATVEGALLSVDPRNGHVLAMVGGRDYHKRSQFNRTVDAKRSPGSAFKPAVYSMALKKHFKWSDVLFVSPINIENYRPRNFKEDYLTETTMYRSFYRSMNTPTIELGQKVGLQEIIDHAKELGIESPIKQEFGSLIGSSDVTMFDLARMYGTYANYGRRVEPVAITKIVDRTGATIYEAPSIKERRQQVTSPQLAYMMTEAMRSVLSRGTGYRSAKLAKHAAGKTGTSNDSTDNWFCGYTPDLVTITWVGTDENVKIRGNQTGGSLALPIWDKFMTQYISNYEVQRWKEPQGISMLRVDPKFGHLSESGIPMPFMRGFEPSDDDRAAKEALYKISSGSYRDVFSH